MPRMNNSQSYRADIDGLRAVAVLAVLFYHLGFEGVGGGLVGVDVFYVISGFLITGMALGDRFSFSDFYVRRFARLMPALAATVMATLVAGYLLFDSAAYKQLAGTVPHALLATSNIYFWQTLSYFDDAALSVPLLHTWSLSVEWQFYLVWPTLLFVANRIGGRKAVVALVVLTIVSSLAAEQVWMRRDATASFYLSPLRAFEMALGGLLQTGPFRTLALPQWLRPSLMRNAVAIAAVSLIGAAVFLKGADTPFPGTWILMPVIGTALIIATPGSWVARILSWRPMVLIGLWSYSLYLVHWPLITFTKYVIYRPLELGDQAKLFIATFVLGILLHYLVERPFRITGKPRFYATATRVAACMALVLSGIGAGIFVNQAQGMPSRISSDYKNSFYGHLPCGTEGDKASLNMPVCTFGTGKKGRILLIGDSHSRHFAYGFSKSPLAGDFEFLSIFSGRCLPFADRILIRDGVLDPACLAAKKEMRNSVSGDFKLVIFSAYWVGYPSITAKELSELFGATKESVFVIGPTPSPGLHRPCNRPANILLSSCENFSIAPRDIEANSLAKAATAQARLNYVDLLDLGCKLGACPFYLDHVGMYADVNHLSKFGSEYYVSRAIPLLEKAL